MDEILKQLKNAQKTVMTTAEKQAMRSHMETLVGGGSSPLHSHLEKLSDIRGPQISPYKTNVFGIGMLVRAAAFVLVGFIVGGTTLTFASTNSLPGDTLYPIKTRVTEPIRRVLALSVESKARYDSERVQTRLAELKTLKDENKLSDPIISVAAEDSVAITFKDYSGSLSVLKNQGREARASEIAQATLNTLDSSLALSVAKTEAVTSMMASSTRIQPVAKTEARGTFRNKVIDNKLESLSSELREISLIKNDSSDQKTKQDKMGKQDIKVENRNSLRLEFNSPSTVETNVKNETTADVDNTSEQNSTSETPSSKVILDLKQESRVKLPF